MNDTISILKPENSPSCEACGSGSTFCFSWPYALETQGKELGVDPDTYRLNRQLRFGKLFTCSICGHWWYLNHNEEMMNSVPDERHELLERWDEKPILLAENILAVLESIGATPAHKYEGKPEYLNVPCLVRTRGGEVFEQALVSFQRHPPIEAYMDPVRLATEIDSIGTSPFALSRKVRYQTAQSDEIMMGAAPTLVEAPDGALFVLNWTVNFFRHGSHKASKLRVSTRPLDMKDIPPIVNEDPGQTVYFVADWHEELERLYIKRK